MNEKNSPHLPDPEVYLGDDGTPRSRVSDDVYFSTSGGIDETEHVFLQGIGGQKFFKNRNITRIAELGFGTGLNFLVTWRHWAKAAPKDATLHYTSVEGYPMSAEFLQRSLASFSELAGETAALIARWPVAVRGMHRLILDQGRVHLTLIFDDVLSALDGLSGEYDAWYLDGFSPAKNPDMWSGDVLDRVRALSAPSVRLATFTAAGQVRRTLTELGFEVEKRKGFGRKRDCVSAYLPTTSSYKSSDRNSISKSVAVIGAGIAGATLAHALRQRGHKPTLLDGAKRPGSAASGNPAALIAPRLTRERVPMGRIIASAYLHAVRFYEELQDAGGDPWLGARGSFVMARNDDEAERQSRSKVAYGWPDDVMQIVSEARASLLTSVDVPKPGLWFAGAGAISPLHVIDQLTDGVPYRQASVAKVVRVDDAWELISDKSKSLGVYDVVCLAAGVGVMDIMGADTFPIRANRGQLTYLASLKPKPNVPITYGGYISPLVPLGKKETGHVLGATYARRDELPDAEWDSLCETDTQEMLDNFAAHLPDIKAGKVVGGRTALRATIRDYIPLAGAWDEGLFVLGGLGSRGFMTAPLLGDLIADQISGTPLPLESDLARALDPKRFKS